LERQHDADKPRERLGAKSRGERPVMERRRWTKLEA
jgi:hypothetical protein